MSVGETSDGDDTGDRPLTTTEGSTAEAGGSGESGLASTGRPLGEALLRFDGVSEYDFGNVAPGSGGTAKLTVRNDGDGVATSIAPGRLPAPFGFQDGGYPGAGGSCGAELGPGDTCTVAVAFAPATFGEWNDALVLTYDGGENAATILSGTSAGMSENLLVNGDAEAGGTPPSGWDNMFGGWTVNEDFVNANSGDAYIFGGPLGGNAVAHLRQIVPLANWVDLVDQGRLEYRFGAFARSQFGDDDYEIRLVFRGAGQAEIDVARLRRNDRVLYEAIQDGETIPADTRSIAVDLMCHRSSGQQCNAMFDDLALMVLFSVAQ